MMDIVNHINELLFRYECVIIPGFGAFLTHHQSAYVDAQSDAFMPPTKTLSFNRQLQTNDGLLVAHLAKSYDVTYQEALQEVREQVEIWIAQLENKTPLNLCIWEFLKVIKKVSGNLPQIQKYIPSDLFGLGPIERVAINREALWTPKQKVVPISSAKSKNQKAQNIFDILGQRLP